MSQIQNRVKKVLSSVLIVAMATIFTGSPVVAGQSDLNLFAGGGGLPPNIMITLDSSGSMNAEPASGGGVSKMDIAKDVLTTLITTINPLISGTTYQQNARFGLFKFARDHGRLLEPITTVDNTQAVIDAIRAISPAGGTYLDGQLLDVARYFAAAEAWGTITVWGSGIGSASKEPAVPNPFDNICRSTFQIVISDGVPNGDAIRQDGLWDTIGDYDGDGGALSPGQLPENEANAKGVDDVGWSDDISQAMFERDFNTSVGGNQNVTTHVIGFDVDSDIIERVAVQGGGLYYTTDTSAGLSAALTSLTEESFDLLASYSTAVVSSSRSAFGSSFYNAYFQPDTVAFWEGHIEAYDLSPSGDILDASGSPAVNPGTNEFYDPPNPHWDAGVELRSNSSRTLYTTLSNLREDFTNNAAVRAALGITAGDVSLFPNYPASNVTTQTLAEDAVINFLHGEDAFDQDGDSNSTELRDKVLGDIFHSTPVVVGPPTTLLTGESGYDAHVTNFAARKRVLYVGANDGMLHGFDAGDLTVGDNPLTPDVETTAVFYTPGSGAELFGYVPGLLLDDVKLVPRNYPRTFYFVDGSPVMADVWLRSSSMDYTRETDEWTTISVTGFREGGAGYMALDVTDPSSTSSMDDHGPYPKFLWEFTDSELGQAWSEPVITRVKVDEGTSDICGHNDGDGNCRERWVAIFGGGYETTADPNHADFAPTSGSPGWSLRSKAIYMVDLATGDILDKVAYSAGSNPNMIYALPSKPAVLDLDFDGFADVAYIGDLGGQMWKWDISAKGQDTSGSDGIIDNWDSGIFFTSGSASDGTSTRYRSFFNPPVASFSRNTLFLAFGSGEREQLEYEGVAVYDENNRVYVIKDYYPTGASAFSNTYAEGNLTDVTLLSYDNNVADQGYFFRAQDGEKFVSDLTVFAGYVIFVSFEIDAGSGDPCAGILGTSKLYVMDIDRGQGYFTAGSPPTAMEERYMGMGIGVSSTPRISMAPDPDDDKMYIKTSKGRVITIDPPPRPGSGTSVIYWKQNQ